MSRAVEDPPDATRREAPDSELGFAQQHDGAGLEVVLDERKVLDDDRRELRYPASDKAANKHKGWKSGLRPGDQRAEVAVGGHQNPKDLPREGEDGRVVSGRPPAITHVRHVVTCRRRAAQRAWARGCCRKAASTIRSGRSSTISAAVIPSATMATTVATGMRRPRTVGMPPITSGSIEIRSKATPRATAVHPHPEAGDFGEHRSSGARTGTKPDRRARTASCPATSVPGLSDRSVKVAPELALVARMLPDGSRCRKKRASDLRRLGWAILGSNQ